MEIESLDHFNIYASKKKLREVKEFNIDVLGFREGFRPGLSGPGHWLYAGDNPILHLSEDENRASRKEKDNLDHIALRCVGVNEFTKRLKEHSIQYRPAYIPDIDLTQLFFDDPVRVTIELNFKGEKLSE